MVHAVLHAHAPGSARIDVTHQIPPHDVRAGALALWRAAPWLAPAVILGVVDPGVGTNRRAVAIEVEAAGTVLVGPDNGLLLPAALRLGRITAAVELAPPSARPPGATFAGRDLFAPAAGRCAAGAGLGEVGEPIDPATLAGQAVPTPAVMPGRVDAEVLWIDRFGNAQLNATPSEVTTAGVTTGGVTTGEAGPGPVRLAKASATGGDTYLVPAPLRVVGSYGAIAPDDVALVVDSYGMLSVCCDRRPAAEELGLAPGDRIRLYLDPDGRR